MALNYAASSAHSQQFLVRSLEAGQTGCIRVSMPEGAVVSVYVMLGDVLAAHADDDADNILRRLYNGRALTMSQVASARQRLGRGEGLSDVLSLFVSDAMLADVFLQRFRENLFRFLHSASQPSFEALDAVMVDNIQVGHDSAAMVEELVELGRRIEPLFAEPETAYCPGDRAPGGPVEAAMVALVTPRRSFRDLIAASPHEPSRTAALVAELVERGVVAALLHQRIDTPIPRGRTGPEPTLAERVAAATRGLRPIEVAQTVLEERRAPPRRPSEPDPDNQDTADDVVPADPTSRASLRRMVRQALDKAVSRPETTLPPRSGARLPPRESTLPPRESTLPPRESTLPPRESTLPPREGGLPPRESTPPSREALREAVRGASRADLSRLDTSRLARPEPPPPPEPALVPDPFPRDTAPWDPGPRDRVELPDDVFSTEPVEDEAPLATAIEGRLPTVSRAAAPPAAAPVVLPAPVPPPPAPPAFAELEVEDTVEVDDLALFADYDRSRGEGDFTTAKDLLDVVDLGDHRPLPAEPDAHPGEVVEMEDAEHAGGEALVGAVMLNFAGPKLQEEEAARKVDVANEVLATVARALDEVHGNGMGRARVQLLVEGTPGPFAPLFKHVEVDEHAQLPPAILLKNLRKRPASEHRRLLNRGLGDLIERALSLADESLDGDQLDHLLEQIAGYQGRFGV